jgi:hypothetical protein
MSHGLSPDCGEGYSRKSTSAPLNEGFLVIIVTLCLPEVKSLAEAVIQKEI